MFCLLYYHTGERSPIYDTTKVIILSRAFQTFLSPSQALQVARSPLMILTLRPANRWMRSKPDVRFFFRAFLPFVFIIIVGAPKPAMKRTIILHPFLFAIYPILFLMSNNIGQFAFEQMIRPMLISLSAALLLTVLFGLAAKNLSQGALSASIILVLFFSYGHVHILIEKNFHHLSHHAILGSLLSNLYPSII